MEKQWVVGDRALAIDPVDAHVHAGHVDLFADLVQTFDLSLRTIRNYRGVANAWPPEKRRYDLPYGVHVLLRPYADRFELIQQKNWTVAQAKELRAHRPPRL
jgi:hypothetical protein